MNVHSVKLNKTNNTIYLQRRLLATIKANHINKIISDQIKKNYMCI